jgi:hypothetical protein
MEPVGWALTDFVGSAFGGSVPGGLRLVFSWPRVGDIQGFDGFCMNVRADDERSGLR